MKLILVILAAVFLPACTTLPEPRLDSVAATGPETQFLEQARRLFSAGEYAQSRARAEQALALNPASAEARFAIAASWFGMQEYQKSIAAGREAAQYRSDLLPDIYLLLGAAYERLDQPWEALRTLRYGGERYPQNPLLHYRLALLYMRLDKPELAADSLKTVLRLDPLNPNPHYQLGMLYAEHGYRVPALLALSVALALEPHGDPVTSINATLDALLGQGVTQDVASGRFVAAQAASNTDEGDFSAIDAELSKLRASLLNRGVKPDAAAMLGAQYQVLFKTLDAGRGETERGAFVSGFYLPLYRAIAHRGLVEAFINRIFEGRQDPAFRQWVAKHAAEVARLQETIRTHSWPAAPAAGIPAGG